VFRFIDIRCQPYGGRLHRTSMGSIGCGVSQWEEVTLRKYAKEPRRVKTELAALQRPRP
jgi:hypothetical protein